MIINKLWRAVVRNILKRQYDKNILLQAKVIIESNEEKLVQT